MTQINHLSHEERAALRTYDYGNACLAVVDTRTDEDKAVMRGMFDMIPSRPVLSDEERAAFYAAFKAEMAALDIQLGRV